MSGSRGEPKVRFWRISDPAPDYGPVWTPTPPDHHATPAHESSRAAKWPSRGHLPLQTLSVRDRKTREGTHVRRHIRCLKLQETKAQQRLAGTRFHDAQLARPAKLNRPGFRPGDIGDGSPQTQEQSAIESCHGPFDGDEFGSSPFGRRSPLSCFSQWTPVRPVLLVYAPHYRSTVRTPFNNYNLLAGVDVLHIFSPLSATS
jgi:hypothetical protein